MKIEGRPSDFCGTKEKRGKNEERISMVKKANAFFFPGSPFLVLSFFPHDFHRKKGSAFPSSGIPPIIPRLSIYDYRFIPFTICS